MTKNRQKWEGKSCIEKTQASCSLDILSESEVRVKNVIGRIGQRTVLLLF